MASPRAATLPTERLADHVRTLRQVEEAMARLGRNSPMRVELGLGR
jgi:hypothetical protein